MVLSPESIAYLHAHHLTCDLEWTCDLAEEIVTEASAPFAVAPPPQSLAEDIHCTLSCLRLTDDAHQTESKAVALALGDTWKISMTQIECFKEFNRSAMRWKKSSQVDEDWWDEGTFEPQIVPIMGDFLLPTSSVRPRRMLRPFINPLEAETIIALHGQALLTTVPTTEPAVRIPTPEELANTKIQLEKSQLEEMKSAGAAFSGFLQSSIPLTNDLLEFCEGVVHENFRRPISPPLIPRKPLTKNESWSTTTNKFAASIRGSLQKEEIPESTPTLSNETWNALDPFPRLSFTPPSSPSPVLQASDTHRLRDILSPELDLERCNGLQNIRNPLETILFAREDQLRSSKTRSTSFDPKQHFNSLAQIFEKNVSGTEMPFNKLAGTKLQVGDETPSIGLEGLVGIKAWDYEKFEREILGTPEDAFIPGSKLKKLSVNLPEPRPMRSEPRAADFFPPDIKAFTLGSASQEKINQDLRKVEGLRALNIDLSWTSYKFSQPMTIEQLTGLDKKEHEAPWNTSASDDGNSYISKRLKSQHNEPMSDGEWPVPFELLKNTPTSPLSCPESFGDSTAGEERPTSPSHSTTPSSSRSDTRESLSDNFSSQGNVRSTNGPLEPKEIRTSAGSTVDNSRSFVEYLNTDPSTPQAKDQNSGNVEVMNSFLDEIEDAAAGGLVRPMTKGFESSSSNISTTSTPPSACFGSRVASNNSANSKLTQKEISSLTELTWRRGSSPIQDFSQEAPCEIKSPPKLSPDKEFENEQVRPEVSPTKYFYPRPLINSKIAQNDSMGNQRKYTRKTLSDSLAEFLTTQLKGR